MRQKLSSPSSLKYLLSGPLQKKFSLLDYQPGLPAYNLTPLQSINHSETRLSLLKSKSHNISALLKILQEQPSHLNPKVFQDLAPTILQHSPSFSFSDSFLPSHTGFPEVLNTQTVLPRGLCLTYPAPRSLQDLLPHLFWCLIKYHLLRESFPVI